MLIPVDFIDIPRPTPGWLTAGMGMSLLRSTPCFLLLRGMAQAQILRRTTTR